jgi:hypothetical protein
MLETIKMEENEGKTTATKYTIFQSVESRDGMIEKGMKGAVVESYNVLMNY